MFVREDISRKMRHLSFFAMFAVILMHVGGFRTAENLAQWNVLLHYWVNEIQQWAVPYFFIVSGFFFDRGTFGKPIFVTWIKTLKKKWITLALPYFSWAVIGGVLVLPLIVANNLQNGNALFSRTIFDYSIGFLSLIDNLFGVTVAPRGNGPLWFLRVLIIVFMISPCLMFLRRMSLLFVGVFGVLFVLSAYYFSVYSVCLGLGFFMLGMMVSALRLEEKKISFTLSLLFGGVYVLMAYADITYGVFPLIALLWILFLWGGYDIIQRFLPKRDVLDLAQISFFVYCLHNPIAANLNGLCGFLLGKSNGAVLFTLLFSFVMTSVISLSAAVLCKRWFPRLSAFLSGGR